MTKAGAYTARIRLGEQSHSFAGQFSVSGDATKTFTLPVSGLVTVNLVLGLTNGPMTGTVSNAEWSAELVAEPAVYSATNPAPEKGKYTMIIPGSTNAAVMPAGNGFGALSVTALGSVAFSGMLGDGTTVSATSIVSSQGHWPLYIPLYSGKGSILGWLNFTNQGVIGGQLGWFKLPQASKLYPDGFTNSVDVDGSTYEYTNGAPILDLYNGMLSLTNGDLVGSITNPIVQVVTGAQNQAIDARGDTVTFKPSSGLFTGTVVNPADSTQIPVAGVVLQNQGLATGVFLGADQSGSVVLSSTQ